METKVLEKTLLHQGRVFKLIREKMRLPNGTTVDLDIIRHPGAAAMVPLKDDGSLVMVRQYRHAVGGYIWEIPAGTLDHGESPLECAKRELIEETGYAAERWEKLGAIIPVPGYSDEKIHIFLAGDLHASLQNLDSDEIIHVREVPFEKAFAMIEKGEIKDSKTITSLFLAKRRLEKKEGAHLPCSSAIARLWKSP
ncbi:MAG: NUDIX hydrolase [Deltaproteobacteria bacterium]|nr:NUDIX hydrolase [Deltaproteobacteria bacterium]